ncbi:autotransporter assembly complex protein TamA [Legionella fairfieldensis]|uniref:autotransporter assembly complex protein TamA n=1 Tax=Legionella fairfieldensis TaxID=45064 RepID=UPI000B2888BF|nr:BamA/TamA family outer membrane protein [Legionella fairfieldensis]
MRQVVSSEIYSEQSINKVLRFLVVTLSLPFLMGVSLFKSHFTITGVKGELLTNIESRLTEFALAKPLSAESDEELRLQIAQAMQPYGYFKPQIILQRQPLRIAIRPGPQMVVTHLNVTITGEGADNIEIRKTLKELPVREGMPLNSAKYEEAKQNLMNAAEHQGYLHATFTKAEMRIDTDRYTAELTLLFDTGPQYYFGQIKFDPTSISPELLSRYVPFRQGQPYSSEQILSLNSQLSSSGYFRSVTITPQTNSTTRYIPVNVHLQPVAPFNYSLGVGYGTDTGIRGRAGFHIVPVNQAGHKFSLVALGSFAQSALQAQYVIPGKNPINDQYNITGNLSSLNYNSGYSNAALLSLGQRHNTSTFQRSLSLNGLYESYRYFLEPKEEKLTFYPKGSFTWLKNEDKLFSPSGYNITLTGLGASKALLSQENFLQTSLNIKAALNIPAIRTRFYFHTIQGVTLINDITQLPLSLALLLGGAENLKGYSFNSIGPGKILTYGGLEIQKETINRWYLVGFFDSGDVYKPRDQQLKNDAGMGLMWVSPVGPIKIGVAWPLDTRFRWQSRTPKFVVNMGPDL